MGDHLSNYYIWTLVEKLGPVPPAWNSPWDEMIARNKELEDESTLALVLGYEVHVANAYPRK